MTTTPPLQPIVRSPPTPHYGAKYDDYQPYATRRSTRSLHQRAAKTPSPGPTNPKVSSRLKKVSAVRSTTQPYSPPSSPQTSPPKSSRKRSDTAKHYKLTEDSKALGQSNKVLTSEQTSALIASMLPTPAKTPRKKAVQPGLSSTARVLFPIHPETIDESMPTPRKKSKKHTDFSLGGIDIDDIAGGGDIEIYTDSKNKVPELDESEENPFYVKPGREPVSAARNTKRRKVSGPAYKDPELEESLKRDDGMVYVFRGKRFFRKFPEADLESPTTSTTAATSFLDSYTETEETTSHFTRSSIKPRLLFPTAAQRQSRQSATPLNITDEEAITDIDETKPDDTEMTEEEPPITTPIKNTFAPATPPTTIRATRSSKKKAEAESDGMAPSSGDTVEYSGGKRGESSSPFDGWQRTKPGVVAKGKGKKRAGESLEGVSPGTKRLRGNADGNLV